MNRSLIKISIITIIIAFFIYYFEIIPRMFAYVYVRYIKINNIDFSKLNDGVYEGEFKYYDIKCKTRVYIKNKKVEKIEVVENNKNDLAKKAEKVVINVINAQSLNVECITGATGSSKAILKSIENTLIKAQKL